MKKYYQNLNLHAKLIFSYVIIISIPMLLIAAFFYGKVFDMIVADTIRNEQTESSKTAPEIERVLDGILTQHQAIIKEPFYTQLFEAKTTSKLHEVTASGDISGFLETLTAIKADGRVQEIRVYIDRSEADIMALQQASGGIFEPFTQARGAYWRGIFSGSGAQSLHCPAFYLSNYEIQNYGDMAYISKQTLEIDDINYSCYTAVYYSSDIFLDILNTSLPSEGSVAYIINDRDAIIATTNPALSGTYFLNYATIQDSFMSSNNFLQRNILEQEIYAGMYNIKQPHWYMVVVIPSKPLIQKSQLLMLQYVLLFCCNIAIAFLIATLLSRSITKRIALVTAQMAKVRTGPPIPLKKSMIHDEIGDLIDTYNYMSSEMNRLMTEMAKAAEELRIAEFNSLQAQINPHFLYNTMDMISWMAASGQTREISDAVQDLSRFYKLTLSKRENISTIEQEIEHVSIYIRLQNMRFHNSIDFVVDIPDELLEYEIPKLTLQPVIENSIHHGIMEKEEKKGCIVLTGWLQDHTIELVVSDNGIGILPEKLNQILSGEGSSKKGSNIAVYNTHHRLQILYGDEYGLSYRSTPGKGTEVLIHLPVKKKQSGFHQNAIIQVSGANVPKDTPTQIVPTQSLLTFNERLANNTYTLRSIHQISEKLPASEPMYIISHSVTEDFPAHNHGYFELTYCCQGTIINCIDGQELIQTAGDLFLLNPRAIHSLQRLESDALLINLALYPELLDSVQRFLPKQASVLSKFIQEMNDIPGNYLYFPMEYNPELQSLLSSVIDEYASADYHYSGSTAMLLLQFICQLAQTGEFSLYGPDQRTFEMLQYLKSHCINENIEKLAAVQGETPESLSAILHRHTGLKAEAIIYEVRMAYAIHLLEKKNINLYDIPKACGYPNADEFSRLFYDKYQLSPEEYRKSFF